MAGFVLRNTLSEFGSVARGVCEIGPDGCLKSVVELTRIERDGAGEKHRRRRPRHEADGRRGRFDELLGFHADGFSAAAREVRGLFGKERADEKAECYIPSTVNDLVISGQARVKVLRTEAPWFGVTYREDRPRVVESIRHLIARGDYPERLWVSLSPDQKMLLSS